MTRFGDYRVADAMTYRPVTVTPGTTLAEAGRLFETRGVRSLPVTQDGRLVGVLTRLDVLKAFATTPADAGASYDDIMQTPVGRVMTVEPVTLAPTAALDAALDTMVSTRSEQLPVVFGALLVGIIARTDVERALEAVAGGRELVCGVD